MARPKRDGLLYFSFDTDFFYADKRIKRFHSKYGNDGLIFYIYLLTEIYRNGYYISWDEEAAEDAAADLRLREGFTEQVLAYLASRSLLTVSTLAGPVTVITSPGIQKRYQEAVKSLRRDVYVNPEIWLLNEEITADCIKFALNDDKSGKNENKSCRNESKSGKNHGKENKTNESNISCAPEPHGRDADKAAQLEKDFEIIYGIYPKKRGRTGAFASYKVWVGKGKDVGGRRYRLSNKQIYLAVRKYIRQQEEAGQDDLTYWK
ncbi:MAG: DUF4373 domain-containing protein, partial [Lachnospiraceae bacterium]|nr:DUF4373 domain-containing protein [Lachnospiraceae bacterium]